MAGRPESVKKLLVEFGYSKDVFELTCAVLDMDGLVWGFVWGFASQACPGAGKSLSLKGESPPYPCICPHGGRWGITLIGAFI